MDKAAIDIAKALVRLSELTIFELRGEWRRLHRMPPTWPTPLAAPGLCEIARQILAPVLCRGNFKGVCEGILTYGR
jgi:hypothetical protein